MLNDTLKDLPNRFDLQHELEAFYVAINKNDDRRTTEVLRKLQEILDLNPASQEQLEAFRTEIGRSSRTSAVVEGDETPQTASASFSPKKRNLDYSWEQYR